MYSATTKYNLKHLKIFCSSVNIYIYFFLPILIHAAREGRKRLAFPLSAKVRQWWLDARNVFKGVAATRQEECEHQETELHLAQQTFNIVRQKKKMRIQAPENVLLVCGAQLQRSQTPIFNFDGFRWRRCSEQNRSILVYRES